MEVEASSIPLDDKAKKMRDLLSSFYSRDPLSKSSSLPANTSSRFATLDTINTTSFDSDRYMNLLVEKSNLEGLLQKHVEMAAEIKNLDTDLQMLVYENYNKFISATDAIKRMKNNITGMETNMEQLLIKITSVQLRSDGVNTSLFEKREHIEKLHRTRMLIRKIQFIYDLPARLEKCIKSEAYADAVKFYTGAVPIFKVYGDSSFEDCKRASEEAKKIIIKKLQVDNLKVKLFEKLEQFLADLHLEPEELINMMRDANGSPENGSLSSHEASIREFVEAVRAYRVIFSLSEPQLTKLAQDLVAKHFEATYQQIKKQVCSKDLLAIFRLIWTVVRMMDEVLPEASLPYFTIQSAQVAVKDFVSYKFTHLLLEISDALRTVQTTENEGIKEEGALATAVEASKKAIMQGSVCVLQEFRQLLDEDSELMLNLRNLAINWFKEGFQNFFKKLDLCFHSLSGKSNEGADELNVVEQIQVVKISAGLVLVLAHFSFYVEQSAIARITEEIASSFSGGRVGEFEKGPSFLSADICRTFQLSRETFLNLYIKMRTQKISVLLRKRFTAPNWLKHKEPREVHMFVDLLLHEFEEIRSEVKQILPQGPHHKHRRTDSNGSTTSSRSNPLREDRIMNRSNITHKGRSQLLETHLAKLFKQKMEIFTKIEHTQESVLTTIVKLPLKSLVEFVRLQTLNRSGFQQIQLDIHFLKSTTLKDIAEDEAAVDFLLDEVIVATAERCLDPIPLEPPVLDRLVQAKLLAKSTEQSPPT